MEVTLKEFNRIIGNINGAYHDVCIKMGISDSEFDVLYMLHNFGDGCNQSVIYRNSGLSKSTINSSIKKMEKNGFIRVEQGTGRNTKVFLTANGKELSSQTVERVIEIENQIFETWSSEEKEMFIKLNEKYLTDFVSNIGRIEASKQ